MNNKKSKQMICDVEEYSLNSCLPFDYRFCFHDGVFGYWVKIQSKPSGWFFRGIYHGVVSIRK